MKKLIAIFTVLLVAVDQIIKYFIVDNLVQYDSIKVIQNLFYITYVKNEGAAFSILPGGRWIFVAVAFIAILLLIRYIISDKKISRYDIVSYSLVLSGIIGNLIDRIICGSVIDYLDLYVFNYNFPVFNFADTCIIIGTFMIIYTLVTKGDSNENIHSRTRVE